jgi:hypothetical protein
MPGSAAAERPREWLALPGGGIRRVVSVPGNGGTVERPAGTRRPDPARPAHLNVNRAYGRTLSPRSRLGGYGHGLAPHSMIPVDYAHMQHLIYRDHE